MYKKSKTYKAGWLYVAFILSVLCSMPVAAETYFDMPVTSEEKAVFAFFRAAKIAPDYEYWIKPGEKYRVLSPYQQESFFFDEVMRLGRGYGMYNINTDLIKIEANILAKYVSATENEQARIMFTFFNQPEEYVPSFNYPYGRGIVSLVINRLAAFGNLPLSPEKAEQILARVPVMDDNFSATLTIHVRVFDAVADSLTTASGKDQWMMTGEVAYLKCEVDSFYTDTKDLLWDYVAPWYEEEFREKSIPEELKYPHPYDLLK